ncbi:MAG: hypothetical protein JXJ22_14995, partial [Bacteroidales bacterium]|nr:hypothetical protein [Bacteroidales bacterium]
FCYTLTTGKAFYIIPLETWVREGLELNTKNKLLITTELTFNFKNIIFENYQNKILNRFAL